MLIGTALSVGSTLWGGYSQSSSLKAQAGIAERAAEQSALAMEANAANARVQAEETRELSTDAARDLKYQQREVMGQQTAQLAASGTTMDSGDVTNIGISSAMLANQDMEALMKNYASQANKYISEAQGYDYQAAVSRTQGANQAAVLRASAKSAMTGSLLSAAGTVASNWSSITGGVGSTSSSGSDYTLYPGSTASDLGSGTGTASSFSGMFSPTSNGWSVNRYGRLGQWSF